MSGVLLKKKKKINVKRHFAPVEWVSVWGSRAARSFNKKLKARKNNRANLQKKRSSVSPHKKYKMFRPKIRPYTSVARHGDAKASVGLIGLRCTSACKLNFSTMDGIKKKSEVLKNYVGLRFRKYPSLLLTRKSTGHRMGKGKGKFSARVAIYKKNEIILEMEYIDMAAFDNYFLAMLKVFPVPVTICYNNPLFYDALSNLGKLELSRFKRKWDRRGRYKGDIVKRISPRKKRSLFAVSSIKKTKG